jgi:hypothetical protein
VVPNEESLQLGKVLGCIGSIIDPDIDVPTSVAGATTSYLACIVNESLEIIFKRLACFS